MPEVLRPDGAKLYYEVAGKGDPLLALAPGGVSSGLSRWAHSPLGSLSALRERCTVVAMDQRHTGLSRSSIAPFSYDDALGDQLAVLDAAGVQQANVLGVGIGAAYALKLAYDAPARVNAVALVWPIGLDGKNNIGDYYAVFKDTIRTARAGGIAAVIEAARRLPPLRPDPGPSNCMTEQAFALCCRILAVSTTSARWWTFAMACFPGVGGFSR